MMLEMYSPSSSPTRSISCACARRGGAARQKVSIKNHGIEYNKVGQVRNSRGEEGGESSGIAAEEGGVGCNPPALKPYTTHVPVLE